VRHWPFRAFGLAIALGLAPLLYAQALPFTGRQEVFGDEWVPAYRTISCLDDSEMRIRLTPADATTAQGGHTELEAFQGGWRELCERSGSRDPFAWDASRAWNWRELPIAEDQGRRR
jgi:hypothetical protein